MKGSFIFSAHLLSRILVVSLGVITWLAAIVTTPSYAQSDFIDLGLSKSDYRQGTVPAGWHLRRGFGVKRIGSAEWQQTNGVYAVRLESSNALTFLEREVDIDIKAYPIVRWKWMVENILPEIDERHPEGDDHPIRLFFVFAPDPEKQSFWFRVQRFFYLDWMHGHPFGGRFTEYLWSSHLPRGHILPDPNTPRQKLMVVESGAERLGTWLSYERNLYEDFIRLYNTEPRKLIFIGILNDTDATGLSAVSHIVELEFASNMKR